MLGFENLTLAPFDCRLIVPELLIAAERDWLNAYHARVRARTLAPPSRRGREMAGNCNRQLLTSLRISPHRRLSETLQRLRPGESSTQEARHGSPQNKKSVPQLDTFELTQLSGSIRRVS